VPGRVTQQTIARLSQYRRLLDRLLHEGVRHVFSHQMAEGTDVTAAQVRRDLMVLGHTGNPRHGYNVAVLIRAIDGYLDASEGQRVAVIGIGNLGLALMAFFAGRRPKLSITAGFDSDPNKVNRVIHGCRIYPIDSLAQAVAELDIGIAIITVPAGEAQAVADKCVDAGIRGLLNFAPIHLRVPKACYVSDVDLTMSLEKVAFFARHMVEVNNAEGEEDDT